jgi:hypothetical protein
VAGSICISGESAEAYDFRLHSSSAIDSRSISCWRAGCRGYARPYVPWPCVSWIRDSPRLRWEPTWGFPPRRYGRSASGILMAGWSGRCSMPPVQARLQLLISNNNGALSPWSARRLQRGEHVGRCGCCLLRHRAQSRGSFHQSDAHRSSPEFADFLFSIAEHYPTAHTGDSISTNRLIR